MMKKLCTIVFVACACGGEASQVSFSEDWPQWQRIESSEPPATWQVEEASPAFDAWEALVVVAEVATEGEATSIRFDDGHRGVLDVRMPALPSGQIAPDLAAGTAVRVTLTRAQGFEGVAHGLVVRSAPTGELLLLYDDGGYGPAFAEDGARAGVGISRALRGARTGDEWESRNVTFTLGGADVTLAEGESARLGDSGLAVSVVVSREWTGEPPTDVDLTPLAYMVFRAR
jgi:hypothetical protein